MASLHVSNDELREMSARYRALANRYQSDAAELKKLISQLSVNWKGAEFDHMIQLLNENAKRDMFTVEILMEIAKNLSQTAEVYEAAEAQLVDDILNNHRLF